jgi:predicted NUDIX family NTP pyrophosphohydrolase
LLLFEKSEQEGIRMLVAHPGGPFFTNRDDGWWSIPKGEPEDGEEIFDAALREFEEETGLPPQGPFLELGDILQKNGKRVYAWAFEGTWPEGKLPECNEITLEFPKGSGKTWTFPEIDRVLMLPPSEARIKLSQEQALFIDRLMEKLGLVGTASKG